jgi:hypothetical protein
MWWKDFNLPHKTPRYNHQFSGLGKCAPRFSRALFEPLIAVAQGAETLSIRMFIDATFIHSFSWIALRLLLESPSTCLMLKVVVAFPVFILHQPPMALYLKMIYCGTYTFNPFTPLIKVNRCKYQISHIFLCCTQQSIPTLYCMVASSAPDVWGTSSP